MSRFDLLLFSVAVLVIVLIVGLSEPGGDDYGSEVELALAALRSQDLSRDRTRGRIEVLATGDRHSAARVVRSLPPIHRTRAVPIVINIGAAAKAAGLARGVDRGYHVWQSFLEHYVPFDVENPWYPLLHLASRKAYSYDHEQYQIGTDEDLWQTSRQAFLEPQGDCEDHAILLADWLIGLGEEARVAVGSMRGEGHAWVVLFRDGSEYLLESTRKYGLTGLKRYPLAALHPEYQPTYQFDREHFWVKTSSAPTVRYRGDHWSRTSRFLPPG
ncbi:MAG: hypothetical protein AAGG11_03940 [Pseudomonadota bacterium]